MVLRRSFAFAAGFLFAVGAQAATMTFADRTAWAAAAGGTSGAENFESFLADVSFLGTSVGLSAGMSIGTVVDDKTKDNIIDVPPPQSDEGDVNGSVYARVFNGQSNVPTTPFISFGTPVSAFGADFKNLNDDILRSRIELFNGATLLDTLTPSTEPLGTVRFFGFVSDQAVTEMRFVRVDNDVFGIDDIQIQGAPEPGTLALLGVGLAGLAAARRRRQ
jgi:hypothetical protein